MWGENKGRKNRVCSDTRARACDMRMCDVQAEQARARKEDAQRAKADQEEQMVCCDCLPLLSLFLCLSLFFCGFIW